MCSRPTSGNKANNTQLVRLAVIEVDSSQIGPYNEYLKEEIEASIRLEPGVLTLYAVAERENPQRVTLFETYADSAQYRSHLETPHFQKYKQGTLSMVKNLQLIEMTPILYHRNPRLPEVPVENLYIRLIRIELDSISLDAFNKLATHVMLPGIRNEPGVMVMYAAAEKQNPTRVSILEVYENQDAYNIHLGTTHYQTYKQGAADLVRALEFIDVDAILLGAKGEDSAMIGN
jgi:quinol monooxygenase YgiN